MRNVFFISLLLLSLAQVALADDEGIALANYGMTNNVSLRYSRQDAPGLAEQLIAQLQRGSAAERTCAATDLGSLRSNKNELLSYLAFALRNDESKWVRRAAAKSLGKLRLTAAIAPLTEALKDSDRWVAHSAANALAALR